MVRLQAISDALFKDKHGKVVVFQSPNIPIGLWFICTIFAKFTNASSTLHHILETVGFGALFTWAWLEIFQGTTYFRRILGGLILVCSIVIHTTV